MKGYASFTCSLTADDATKLDEALQKRCTQCTVIHGRKRTQSAFTIMSSTSVRDLNKWWKRIEAAVKAAKDHALPSVTQQYCLELSSIQLPKNVLV